MPLRRNVRLLYFRYEITMGSFLFEWWEKALIFLIFVGLLLLISTAVYRLVLGVIARQQWHFQSTNTQVPLALPPLTHLPNLN